MDRGKVAVCKFIPRNGEIKGSARTKQIARLNEPILGLIFTVKAFYRS